MTDTASDKEFEAVTRLAPEARYEHFVMRAADRGEVWALARDDPQVRRGRKLPGGFDFRSASARADLKKRSHRP